MIFDDEKRRRKKEAEEFERIVREMERIIEEAFKSAFNMQPFIKGFSLKIDKEPVDIIEDESKLYITLELPNIKNEREIKIKAKENFLEIKAGNVLKEIELPCKVKKKMKKTFKNGILDIELIKA